jgi:hypothetical protein
MWMCRKRPCPLGLSGHHEGGEDGEDDEDELVTPNLLFQPLQAQVGDSYGRSSHDPRPMHAQLRLTNPAESVPKYLSPAPKHLST